MSTFKIAHIKEQGVNVIIAPLAPHFEQATPEQRAKVMAAFTQAALDASLRGRVVLVWRTGMGFKFIAPVEWQPFFRSLRWRDILGNLNRDLECPTLAEELGVQPPQPLMERLKGWIGLGRKGQMSDE